MSLSRISSKGQVVIPKPIREQLGLTPGSRLKITMENGRIILIPYTATPRELLVEGNPEAVSEALHRSRGVDERKIEALLRALG